jgi:hypothetical protein
VNLAPPGPPGEDWRSGLNFGPPGSSVGPDEPLLGHLPDDDLPLPPVAELAFAPPAPPPPEPDFAPRLDETTLDDTYAPSPYDTGGFGAVDEPAFTLDGPAFEPTPFEPAPESVAPITFELGDDPLATGFGSATPADFADFGLGDDQFDPTSIPFAEEPVPPPPGPDPWPEPSFDEATFRLPSVADDDLRLPTPPSEVARPEPPAPEPVAPPMPEPVVVASTPPAPRGPETEHARPVTPDVPRPAIRPPTPTRIPAAKAQPEKDAKAMLARIAALRDKD